MLVFDPNSRWPPGRDSWQDADSGKLQDFCSGNQPGDGGRGEGGRWLWCLFWICILTKQMNAPMQRSWVGDEIVKLGGVGVGDVCNTPRSRILCLSTAAVGSLLSPFYSLHPLSVCLSTPCNLSSTYWTCVCSQWTIQFQSPSIYVYATLKLTLFGPAYFGISGIETFVRQRGVWPGS